VKRPNKQHTELKHASIACTKYIIFRDVRPYTDVLEESTASIFSTEE
jgi:hypothetical protein